ncbi:MAG: type VI secretion system contractile sheath large subunit [Planctomycetes bacterium]|nr:type VI secretion system contractile sheath large subunit [Planctomycetota bacterium]
MTDAEQERAQGSAAEAVTTESLLDQIVHSSGRRTKEQQLAVRSQAEEFARQIAQEYAVGADAVKAIDSAIARLDQLLSAQLNEVLHNEKFQQLEATWRGLSYLVSQSETGEQLKIKVINISKRDLLKDLQNAAEFDQSAMFKKIYEEEFGIAGGSPFGALVADYHFDVKHPEDMTILENMAGIAAASHAPFITGASPETFQMDSFEQLADPRDLSKIFDPKLNPEMIRWNTFRKEWEDARYVGLCLPHILMRLPYGEKTCKVDLFNFEEDVTGRDHGKYLWGNAAWALATRMSDAYAKYGWCVNITGREGGGTVQGLPVHTFKTDTGENAYKIPTEIGITDRRDRELDQLGFIPLCHYKDTDYAVFFSAHSAQKPKEYDDPDASASAELSVHLTYLMAVSRFAHYMKVILRDKLGTLTEGEEIEAYLNRWFNQYTLANPEGAGERLKSEKPLREFSVSVKPVEGKPGYYEADLRLRPHYQLQDINMSLHLVSQVKKG